MSVDRGTPQFLIRRREPGDLPALAQVLRDQQPGSRYPFRDPLPVPVEQFLHADDAGAAWTAVRGGEVVGHVCRVAARADFADAEAMNAACAEAHGCTTAELAWLSAFFVSRAERGRGTGRALLRRAVDEIRQAGLRPCLEVLPIDPAALGLYRAEGWQEVLRLRPDWLREANGTSGPDVVVMVLVR